jgi:hypothetical protein
MLRVNLSFLFLLIFAGYTRSYFEGNVTDSIEKILPVQQREGVLRRQTILDHRIQVEYFFQRREDPAFPLCCSGGELAKMY